MPVIKSAMKRVRQETVRRERNRKVRDELHAPLKAFAKALAAKDSRKAAQHLKAAQSQLDRAAKKGIIHKNAASRRMARLHAHLKALGGPKSKATAKTTVAKKAPAQAAGKPKATKSTKNQGQPK